MNTIQVYWKGKFNGKAVTINADEFDATIHRPISDGDWPSAKPVQAEPKPEPVLVEAETITPARKRSAR